MPDGLPDEANIRPNLADLLSRLWCLQANKHYTPDLNAHMDSQEVFDFRPSYCYTRN